MPLGFFTHFTSLGTTMLTKNLETSPRYLTDMEVYEVVDDHGGLHYPEIFVWQGQRATPAVIVMKCTKATRRFSTKLANYAYKAMLGQNAYGMIYAEVDIDTGQVDQVMFEHYGNIQRPHLIKPQRRTRDQMFLKGLNLVTKYMGEK